MAFLNFDLNVMLSGSLPYVNLFILPNGVSVGFSDSILLMYCRAVGVSLTWKQFIVEHATDDEENFVNWTDVC